MRKSQAHIFTGAMDDDSDIRAIEPGNYKYANNILNGSASMPGAVTNMLGAELQDYTLPSGLNICIGAIEDKVGGSLVYFVWNINENHRVLRFFQNDGHIEEIFGGNKLNFDRYSRIQGFILDGRLMYWTEAKTDKNAISGNEPRATDLTKASNYNKPLVYEFIAGVDGQGQFAENDEFTFEVQEIDGTPLDPVVNQVITIPDGTYLSDVQAGLEYIYDELTGGGFGGPLDDYISVELCDCKLTITMLNAGQKLAFTLDALTIEPLLVPSNFYGHVLGDAETFHFALKKEPPSCAPTPSFINDPAVGYNNVRDGCFQFRTRFLYDDGGHSAWSAASNVALNNAEFGEPQEELNSIRIDYSDERLSDIDWLAIIDYVEIAVRDGNTDVWRLIQRVPICEVPIGTAYIDFANDNQYNVIPSDDPSVATGDIQVLTNYFRVPYRAGAIAPISADDGNVRLAFGAVQEGQVCPTCVNGFVEAVQYDNPDLVDIIGTVEIINDPDASITTPSFPLYDNGSFGLEAFVVYLAGTNYYALSDNPADGSGTGAFRIKNVPRGQYSLRVASYACRYDNSLGDRYDLTNGIEWQKTSSPLIDCAGSVAENGLKSERIIDLYGFVGDEFDLDTEVGYGPIQIQNYHQCPKISAPGESLNVVEFHCLDADGLYSTYAERLPGKTVENLEVSFAQGTSDLAFGAGTERTDFNGYAWVLIDSANGTKLRPVVASWGGDNTNGAQDYHVFNSFLGGWKAITDEDYSANIVDLNDGETGYDINSATGALQGNIAMSFVFNPDPDWTTANLGTITGRALDVNGNPVSGVSLWMLTNGRFARTNVLGEYSILVYAYDGFSSRTAFQELRPVYLPDSGGDYTPSPQFDSTAFDIPSESPLENIDFEFGFAGGISSNARFRKSGGHYKVGVVYEDDAGRSPCGATPLDTVRIPFHTQDGEYVPRQIQWTIESRPPNWATRFRIVITKDSFYQTYKHLPVTDVKYVRIPENATMHTETTYTAGDATHIMLAIRTQVPDDPNALPTLLMFRDNIQTGYSAKFGDRVRYMLDETQTPVFTDDLVEVAVSGEYIDGEKYWVVIPYTDIQREVLTGWMFEFFTPKGFEEEVYWEAGYCYELLVEPLRHSGDIQDQELGLTPQPAIGLVQAGDTYWRLNQFELEDSDGINLVTEYETKNRYVDHRCEDIGRPFAVDDQGDEQIYTNRIRFSGLYVPDSNINDLSSYGALDYQSLNRTFGTIKWMGMVHTVLLAICQNKTQPVYVGKGRMIDLSGATTVGRSDAILSIGNESTADAGTLNPESVAVHDGQAYWWDLQRATVWRYAGDGISSVNRGKINYFRDRHDERVLLDAGTDICPGGIDRRHNLYFLTFGLEYYLGPEDVLTPVLRDTLMFDPEKFSAIGRGWVSHTDMHSEAYSAANNELAVFNGGRLYIAHRLSGTDYNDFFATNYESRLIVPVNVDPQTMKDWLSLRIQADKKWWAPEVEILPTASWPNGMFSRIRSAKMVLREGQWWAEFMRDMTDPRTEFTDISDDATRETTALLRGRFLKGDAMLLTIETYDGSVSNILMRVDVEYADSQNTK